MVHFTFRTLQSITHRGLNLSISLLQEWGDVWDMHRKRQIVFNIPPRDKSIVAKAKPALGRGCSRKDQVMNAFVHGFSKYNNALKALSKVRGVS